MFLYLDSSAVIKLYLEEDHSLYVRGLIAGLSVTRESYRNYILLSTITRTEVYSALARRSREGDISEDEALELARKFDEDLRERFIERPLTTPVLAEAPMLTFSLELRAYDAIQLATARVLKDEVADLLRVRAEEALRNAPSGRFAREDIADALIVEHDALMLTFDADLHAAAVAEGYAHENPNPACPGGQRFIGLAY